MISSSSLQRNAPRRGTATIEAVMALFVFVLVWAGVHYMGDLYNAQLRTESEARTCAWLISAGACEVEVKGCSLAVRQGNTRGIDAELQAVGQSQKKKGKFADAVTDKLMGPLSKLFGQRGHMTVGAEVARPQALGGKTTGVSSSYSLPCSTKATNTDELANSLMDSKPWEQDP
jgi:hypothetical protein